MKSQIISLSSLGTYKAGNRKEVARENMVTQTGSTSARERDKTVYSFQIYLTNVYAEYILREGISQSTFIAIKEGWIKSLKET